MSDRRNFHGLSDVGEFYRNRDEWVRHVLGRTEWDPSWRMVCVAIAMRANPDSREPFPKQTRIGEDLGLNKRTVRRAVSQAVAEGLFVISKRRPLRAQKGAKPVNHYALIPPSIAAERVHMSSRSEDTQTP